jgi:hypothetical protein
MATPSPLGVAAAAVEGPAVASDLTAVDDILAEYHLERRVALELQARAEADREHFLRTATHALRCTVRPALDAIAARLVGDGAGGRVDERSNSERPGMRLVLWMSLDGPVAGQPREDRNPYLRLDLDVPGRQVRVWEGDMWLGYGASRPAPALTLDQLTTTVVTQRAMAVLRRAAAQAGQVLTTLMREGNMT